MRVDNFLPTSCYNPASVLHPEGVLIHHISAKNVQPNRPYDPARCYQIFIDESVSAHFMVLRGGDIWNLVPPNRQAWHAGVSSFRGRDNLNHSFFGIEFIGDEENDFEETQYTEGALLVRNLMVMYNIGSNMIKGHEQVAGPSVRKDYKRDPGPAWDWIRFGALIGGIRGLSTGA